MRGRTVWLAIALCASLSSARASGEIAVSANDAHSVLVNGVTTAPKSPPPDNLAIIDLSHAPPKVIATVDVPTSVAGPPMAVALSRDARYAIVSSANKVDLRTPGKIIPNDEVAVVDLRASPPRVQQRTHAGMGATGIAISPDQKLVLIANRKAGTLSVFTFDGGTLTLSQNINLGQGAGPCGVVFTKDGATALVTRDDNFVSVLHVQGDKITIDPRPIVTGVHPYTIDISADGALAAVSNMGDSNGDVTTVSLIDLRHRPFRTVEQAAVPSAPEGLAFSPDGKFLAVGSQDNSNKPKSAFFYHDHGTLSIFAVSDDRLRLIATTPVGKWSQGIAFSKDGGAILVQNMVEQNISVFRFENGRLTPEAPVPVGGGAASIATVRPF